MVVCLNPEALSRTRRMTDTPAIDDFAANGGLARPAGVSARVYETLRQAIVRQQLSPGNLLSEADLARRLGVSRQPVREAFIKLAEASLVEVRPQRGTFVRLISRREVEDARFLREAVEVALVRRAATSGKAGTADTLRRSIRQQHEAAGDPDAFLALDEAFHLEIARGADCETAWRLLDGLKAQMDRVRYLSVPFATAPERLIAQHEAIVTAIAAGDADAAEAAMRTHLAEILDSLPRLAAANPDQFTD
jgi:GntR family transcriptional regulator, rspAB operon transcriptional repressor